MVSKARLDLPEPESPVTTTSLSRGISSETFFRLCTRAPCTAMVVRIAALAVAVLELIGRFPHVDEGQFLHDDVALPGELDGRGDLFDEPLVGQVLAGDGHAPHVEIAREVVLEFRGRACLSDFAQVIQ